MDSFWLLLIMVHFMVIYTVVLVRASMHGRQWAIDTLKAIRFMSDESVTVSMWLAMEADPAADDEPEPWLDA